MNRSFIFLFTLIIFSTNGQTAEPPSLFTDIMLADSAFFQSMNDCNLADYESFLTDDFEFYHDKGGFTKSKEAEMKSMSSFCGEQRERQKIKRVLIKETADVSPIKEFGAVETGRHRFYLVLPDGKEKLIEQAKFTNLWQQQGTGWKLSRVISYDHEPVAMVKLSDKVLDQYVGKYQMAPDRVVEISRGGALLQIKDGDFSAELLPESETKFYLNFGDVQFVFVKVSGKWSKIVVFENGKQLEEGSRTRN
jgi:hypothetical protein